MCILVCAFLANQTVLTKYFTIFVFYLQPTWFLKVYCDDEYLTELGGIPPLSTNTKLFLHLWNRNNVLPPVSNPFDPWSARAIFMTLIMPPAMGSPCRYGDPFRGGTNGIIKYDVGVGTSTMATDVVPFRTVRYLYFWIIIVARRHSNSRLIDGVHLSVRLSYTFG